MMMDGRVHVCAPWVPIFVPTRLCLVRPDRKRTLVWTHFVPPLLLLISGVEQKPSADLGNHLDDFSDVLLALILALKVWRNAHRVTASVRLLQLNWGETNLRLEGEHALGCESDDTVVTTVSPAFLTAH